MRAPRHTLFGLDAISKEDPDGRKLGIKQRECAAHLRNLAEDIEAGHLTVNRYDSTESIGTQTYGHTQISIVLVPVKRPYPEPDKRVSTKTKPRSR